MIRRVDQLLAGFADGDAISHEALLIRDMLRSHGIDSDLYADLRHVSPSLRSECRDAMSYEHEGIALHHYSIGSPVLDRFASLPGRKVLIYHNITPPEYFQAFDGGIAARLEEARNRLPSIAASADAVWAVSEFNASELKDMGVGRIRVFPLLFDGKHLNDPDDPEIRARFAAPLMTFLTVGRIAPNKRLEDAIRAYHWYHRKINPYSRLVIVGSARSCPRYYDMLQMLVADLDVANVCFEGFAAPECLATYYRCAHLYLSTSSHEGYCLPLVEAMYHGVPVVAHGVGGMPEAMAGSGVLYRDLEPAELAVLLDRVTGEADVRTRVLASQTKRLEALRNRRPEEELMKLLNELSGN